MYVHASACAPVLFLVLMAPPVPFALNKLIHVYYMGSACFSQPSRPPNGSLCAPPSISMRAWVFGKVCCVCLFFFWPFACCSMPAKSRPRCACALSVFYGCVRLIQYSAMPGKVGRSVGARRTNINGAHFGGAINLRIIPAR